MDHLIKVSNSKMSLIFWAIFFLFACYVLSRYIFAIDETSADGKGVAVILFGISGWLLVSHKLIAEYTGEKLHQWLALAFRVTVILACMWVIYFSYFAFPD